MKVTSVKILMVLKMIYSEENNMESRNCDK